MWSKKSDSNITNVSVLDGLEGVSDKDETVSITYEEIGFFPRSFSRVLDRFLKQIFSDVENLVVQEYRFYRYLFLTTLKCLFILFFVPFLVHFFAKNYLIHPLTEYFWNKHGHEIFLNSYQQKRAFAEIKDFEEKLYFESLISSNEVISSASLASTSLASTSLASRRDASNTRSEGGNALAQVQSKNLHNSLVSPELITNGNGILVLQKADEVSTYAGSHNELPNIFSMVPMKGTFKEEVTKITKQSKIQNKKSHSDTKEFEELVLSDVSSFSEEKMAIFSPSDNSYLRDGMVGDKTAKTAKTALNGFLQEQKQAIKSKKELFEQRLQEKTMELAFHYNNLSIEALTNFFADLLSLFTLWYLLITLEIQINITKSFLLEVFFGLDDSKKSVLILLFTDLLVGYHSSNLWELFFEFLFNHYGLPESQTGIFLLVATLPVLLDVLFKYIIFRHLNRSSPATVATYHAMIE